MDRLTRLVLLFALLLAGPEAQESLPKPSEVGRSGASDASEEGSDRAAPLELRAGRGGFSSPRRRYVSPRRRYVPPRRRASPRRRAPVPPRRRVVSPRRRISAPPRRRGVVVVVESPRRRSFNGPSVVVVSSPRRRGFVTFDDDDDYYHESQVVYAGGGGDGGAAAFWFIVIFCICPLVLCFCCSGGSGGGPRVAPSAPRPQQHSPQEPLLPVEAGGIFPRRPYDMESWIALDFVRALEGEYQQGRPNSVGDFFESDGGHRCGPYMQTLDEVESRVRDNPDLLGELRREWNL